MAAALFILFCNKEFRRQRIFRDRNNPLDTLNDDELISRYRFPRHIIVDIAESLRYVLDHPTTRSSSIPAHIQILTALRFFAKGDYQSEVGDLHGVSQPSTSRMIHRVCAAINARLHNIKFPCNGRELRTTKEGFHSIAGFPNVIGCIDGTLIPIQGMAGADEPNFVCRKGFHAINVQAVADHSLRFTNVVVKWPGSTHDAFILQQSALYSYMEGHSDIGWLLGDSGYPLKPWLITPIAQPMTGQQQRFNHSHTRTRNVVERAFGVLKQRFRCLHKTGGALSYCPERSIAIIEACFILHNVAVTENIPLHNGPSVPLYHNSAVFNNAPNQSGQRVRDNIVQRF